MFWNKVLGLVSELKFFTDSTLAPHLGDLVTQEVAELSVWRGSLVLISFAHFPTGNSCS